MISKQNRVYFWVSIIVVLWVVLTSWTSCYGQEIPQYYTNKTTVILEWSYDFTTNVDVAGFNLYTQKVTAAGVAIGGPTITNIVGQVLTYSVLNVVDGSYQFYMTVYDKYKNESDYSSKIQLNKKTFKPDKPTNFLIKEENITLNTNLNNILIRFTAKP